jgi:hypothetical protein
MTDNEQTPPEEQKPDLDLSEFSIENYDGDPDQFGDTSGIISYLYRLEPAFEVAKGMPAYIKRYHTIPTLEEIRIEFGSGIYNIMIKLGRKIIKRAKFAISDEGDNADLHDEPAGQQPSITNDPLSELLIKMSDRMDALEDRFKESPGSQRTALLEDMVLMKKLFEQPSQAAQPQQDPAAALNSHMEMFNAGMKLVTDMRENMAENGSNGVIGEVVGAILDRVGDSKFGDILDNVNKKEDQKVN